MAGRLEALVPTAQEPVSASHSACRLVRLKSAWAGSCPVKKLLESTLQAVGGGEGAKDETVGKYEGSKRV